MTEKLSFPYKSIGNLLKLLVSIQWEKIKPMRDITVFHQRFDNEKDEVFEDFIKELYPKGATIGLDEIEALVKHITNFMKKDKQSQNYYVAWDKRHISSWVYFKIDNTIHKANMGHHAEIVRNICCDFFKDFEEVKEDYLKKFILENFEIKSDFTTLERVANDTQYIAHCIKFNYGVNKE